MDGSVAVLHWLVDGKHPCVSIRRGSRGGKKNMPLLRRLWGERGGGLGSHGASRVFRAAAR